MANSCNIVSALIVISSFHVALKSSNFRLLSSYSILAHEILPHTYLLHMEQGALKPDEIKMSISLQKYANNVARNVSMISDIKKML